jgi:hypothetical protein
MYPRGRRPFFSQKLERLSIFENCVRQLIILALTTISTVYHVGSIYKSKIYEIVMTFVVQIQRQHATFATLRRIF